MEKGITICLVTANRPKEFRKALRSIASLSIRDYKVIVADDSSNDESEKITKEIFPEAIYFRNDPPLREIANSNKCISLAQTDIVCLFHDDDLLAPNYFDVILPYMSKNDDIDMAFTGRIMVDQNDEELARQVLKAGKEHYIYAAHDILDFMLFGKKLRDYRVFINTPGLVFRKSVFEKFGGFDSSIDTHCDTDFLFKSLLVSRKVLFINTPLYINKLWYGVSGRTKSSERGDVLMAQKGVRDNFIAFCERNGYSKYVDLKNSIYDNFALEGTHVNGFLGWISLRYKGSYLGKVRSIIKTAADLIRLNAKVLLYPRFYFVFLASILIPQFVQKMFLGILLKLYNRKT